MAIGSDDEEYTEETQSNESNLEETGMERSFELETSTSDVDAGATPSPLLTSVQQLGNFDFSAAKDLPRWIPKERTPDYKSYRIKKKNGKNSQFTFSIVIHKSKLEDTFQNISTKLGINKNNTKKMVISYPIKKTDGSVEIMSIAGWDADRKTSLEVFYGQTASESLLEVEMIEKLDSDRGERPAELKRAKISKHNTTDRTVYQEMVQDPSIVQKFEH